MSEAVKKDRPSFGRMTFADTVHYRLPLAAYVSLFHRVSGATLFFLLPFLLYLFEQSLTSESTFDYLKAFASHWFVKLLILAVSWAYLHHFTAGVRHLLMDLHFGLDKAGARKSAVVVFAVSLPLTLLVALKLFGVF